MGVAMPKLYPTVRVHAGQRFGRLTVISVKQNRYTVIVTCLCDCGSIKETGQRNLIYRDVGSCGCLRIEAIQKAGFRNYKHGHARHGKGKRSPTYMAWQGMIERCHNASNGAYPRYGARGIVVCHDWRASFVNFLECVGEKPSSRHQLDRIDSLGNYEPGNVRWATP